MHVRSLPVVTPRYWAAILVASNALASFGAMPNQLPLSPVSVWHMGVDKRSTGEF